MDQNFSKYFTRSKITIYLRGSYVCIQTLKILGSYSVQHNIMSKNVGLSSV